MKNPTRLGPAHGTALGLWIACATPAACLDFTPIEAHPLGEAGATADVGATEASEAAADGASLGDGDAAGRGHACAMSNAGSCADPNAACAADMRCLAASSLGRRTRVA